MPLQNMTPEIIVENNLIAQLQTLGYEGVTITDSDGLVGNLKSQLERFNKTTFTEKDFTKILNHLEKGNVFEKAKILRDKFQYLKDDAGLGKVTKNAGADLKTLKESDASQYSLGVDFKAQKDLTFGVGISYFDGDYTDAKGHTDFDDTLIFVSTRYLF